MTSGSAPDSSTPLVEDESHGLIPTHITTQGQLNEWESENILTAVGWATSRGDHDVVTDSTARELHRRMFDRTWEWAGKYRRTDKNIGVPWRSITTAVRDGCDDINAWIDAGTYSPLETAVRAHHRLVLIHPFPNGNGRVSRLWAEMIGRSLGLSAIPWGGSDLGAAAVARNQYLNALRRADKGDFGALLAFCAQVKAWSNATILFACPAPKSPRRK